MCLPYLFTASRLCAADSTQLVRISQIRHTVVSYDNDVDTAMQVHLLQAVHQVTDDVIDLSQRVVQLWTGNTRQIKPPSPGQTHTSHSPHC